MRQLQHGCGKQICFNPDCKTNIVSKFSLTKDPREFSSDQQILTYTLVQIRSGREVVICQQPDEDKEQSTSEFLLSTLEWFCCAFVGP